MRDYLPLDTVHGLSEVIQASHAGPVAILKHSTSCSISHLAKARVDKALRGGELAMSVYLVDLLRDRSVSDHVAGEFGVRHESPQVILLENGEVRYVASHLDIDPYAWAGVGTR